MGPKKKVAVEAAPLDIPAVSEEEVLDAKKFLDDKEVKHRQNSNLMYWLEAQGKKDGYNALTPTSRKKFFLHWVAKSIKEGNAVNRTWRKINNKKEDVDKGKWMAKYGMTQLFGEQKALAKINLLNNKADRHRPDRDTGLDDEWNREYKIYEDEEINTHSDDIGKTLESEKEITSEKEKEELAEDMQAAGILEPSSSASAGAQKPMDAKVKIEGQKPEENLKTFNSIKEKPKAVLRSLSESLTEAKRIFEVASDKSKSKYLGPLKTDVEKLIPKFKSTFNSVEKIHLKCSSEDADPVPDPEILAVARKMDAIYSEFSVVVEWFSRMAPAAKKAKKDP